MDISTGHPSSQTSRPPILDQWPDWWTSSLRGSRANPTLQLDDALAKLIHATFGRIPSQPLAQWDRNTSCWRTCQASFLEMENGNLMGARWSDSFPISGMTHSGSLYQLQPLVPRTLDGGGGAWHIPSPTVSDLYTGNLVSTQQSDDTNHSVTLPQWAERYPTPQAADGSDVETGFGLRDYVNHKRKYMLPTPTVSDAPDGGGPPNKNANTTMWDGVNSLGQMAKQGHWPTPHSSAGTGPGTQGREGGMNIQTAVQEGVGGKLSAVWVEWLMGLPEGWVSLVSDAIYHWDDYGNQPRRISKWVELASAGKWWYEERGLPRVVDDQKDRVPMLKSLGNGIVPQCIPIFLRVSEPEC